MMKGNDSKDKECPRSLRKSMVKLILEINFSKFLALGFHHTIILLQNIAVIRKEKKEEKKGTLIKKLFQYFA